MVYSVCSLEPEEGEQVLEAFLAGRRDFELHPIEADETPSDMRPNNGILRILPGTFADKGGADGFFIARLRRINGG
jgi:16S rRNA (cytosine967-C5)-methyltransferase